MKILLLLCLSVFSRAESGFVQLKDHQVFVDYSAAAPGKPTVVLVNGLVYGLERWNDFARPLADSGLGVLRYNFRGQSRTLLKELEKGDPDFFRSGLDRRAQAEELAQLLNALQIEKAVIVGLSYGAGIAAEFGERYPAKVEQLVFLAPLVVPLDRYDPNGAWINMNLDALKFWWGPLWGAYVYDYYYNQIYRSYMSQRLVGDRIPAEMRGHEEAYKESIFHLVRAMRDLDLRTFRFAKLEGRVHMLLASEEDAPALKDQFLAWKNFGKGGSLILLAPAGHAIPDSAGAFAAEVVTKILSGFEGSYLGLPQEGRLEPASPEELERRAGK
jgi:pimeloyl-ACP methyl ester carboxylesterase